MPYYQGKMVKNRPGAAEALQGEMGKEEQLSGESQRQAGESRNRFIDTLGGGQAELEQSIQSAMSSAMPGFRNEMQGVQETEQRRGIGLGGLGTSYEGDLESAFHRNIANAAGSQAMNLYSAHLGGAQGLYETDTAAAGQGRNRYLDLLTGQRDYDTAQQNAKRKRKHGLFGAIGGALGGIGGFMLGGPMGAELGSSLGGSLGGSIG